MEAVIKSEEQRVREKSRKSLLYWAIGSMVIFFSGFCSAYMVVMGSSNWIVFELPDILYVSTAVIVASSITLFFAQGAIRKNDHKRAALGLGLTLILGLTFALLQFLGWKSLVENGIFFVGNNQAGSFLYVITFFHLAHLFFGLIALLISMIKASKKRYNSNSHLGFSLTVIFWHFLDILWVVLFLFLVFNR